MANQEEDDDDDLLNINPITTLLLTEEDENEVPLPASEQPQQQHHYFRSIESTVVIRQLPSQGLSFQLWPAATTFVTLFDSYCSNPSTSPLSATIADLSNALAHHRILEIGSGTGLVGIATAAILGAKVTVTDLPHVLPNLQFNVEANSDALAIHGGAVIVAPLRWGEDEDMEAIGKDYDLILGSDVVYYDYLYEPLLKTLRFFLLGGENEKKKKVFLMAHLKRWKKESAFFKKAKKVFDVEIMHADGPASGSRVGVVVYRFAGKGCLNVKFLVEKKI